MLFGTSAIFTRALIALHSFLWLHLNQVSLRPALTLLAAVVHRYTAQCLCQGPHHRGRRHPSFLLAFLPRIRLRKRRQYTCLLLRPQYHPRCTLTTIALCIVPGIVFALTYVNTLWNMLKPADGNVFLPNCTIQQFSHGTRSTCGAPPPRKTWCIVWMLAHTDCKEFFSKTKSVLFIGDYLVMYLPVLEAFFVSSHCFWSVYIYLGILLLPVASMQPWPLALLPCLRISSLLNFAKGYPLAVQGIYGLYRVKECLIYFTQCY
mmetsp:Transcript_15979/g.28039  ORF Transcript_15979/g.28039 Transcript_15979/m.28039 type:complete len:262 (-) Transcript_15979:1261-2046(-)